SPHVGCLAEDLRAAPYVNSPVQSGTLYAYPGHDRAADPLLGHVPRGRSSGLCHGPALATCSSGPCHRPALRNNSEEPCGRARTGTAGQGSTRRATSPRLGWATSTVAPRTAAPSSPTSTGCSTIREISASSSLSTETRASTCARAATSSGGIPRWPNSLGAARSDRTISVTSDSVSGGTR